MTAAEFVDGTGPQLPTVGSSGGLDTPTAAAGEVTPSFVGAGVTSPAPSRGGSEASATAVSRVAPLPTGSPSRPSLDVTDAEGRQVRERPIECSRCRVKTWNFSARCDRCEGLFAPMAILNPADFIDVLPAPSPRDDERSERG